MKNLKTLMTIIYIAFCISASAQQDDKNYLEGKTFVATITQEGKTTVKTFTDYNQLLEDNIFKNLGIEANVRFKEGKIIVDSKISDIPLVTIDFGNSKEQSSKITLKSAKNNTSLILEMNVKQTKDK